VRDAGLVEEGLGGEEGDRIAGREDRLDVSGVGMLGGPGGASTRSTSQSAQREKPSRYSVPQFGQYISPPLGI